MARIADSENVSYTHDYEELLVGIKGTLEHFIDFDSRLIEAPVISFESTSLDQVDTIS